MVTYPTRIIEDSLCQAGGGAPLRVAGTDEAGRGAWVGPVVAAAVVLDPDQIPPGINDSKKIPKARRILLHDAIMGTADVGIGQATVEEIDALNILQASLLAMRRAVAALTHPPDHVLVDGNRDPGLGCRTQLVIGGDRISLSIAAASIIAKVTRDRLIADAARDHPAYGWEQNAGYGTAAHREALNIVGISPFHRKSFRPISEILPQES
ncbi:MAG: ribonuclease HII [Sphingomonadales bacterium]